MAVDNRERILGLAKVGPVLPMQVAKALNTDSLMASAMLAELVTNNKLKVSKLKVGSSPLYYLPEEKAKLADYIHQLNDKEQKAVKFLQEKFVLREKDLDPLTRVCLKNAKDFAYPLEVVFESHTELFWKWFLVTDQEAEIKIKSMLSPKEEPKQIEKIAEPELIAKPKKKAKEAKAKSADKQAHFTEEKTIDKEQTKPLAEPSKIEKEEIIEEAKEKPVKEKKPLSLINPFAQKLEAFMKQNNITISEQISSKKNEFELIVEVPSSVGMISHYCSAKSKKITDAEVSQAFVQGQLRKLPVLLLVDGETTKKAEEILASLKGIVKKDI